MKKTLLVVVVTYLFFVGLIGVGHAVPLTAVSITGTGNYNAGGEVLITDGVIPAEGTQWQTTTAFWTMSDTNNPEFTIDYGSILLIEDVVLSVDNNDSYTVEYSVSGTSWSNLFNISYDIGDRWDGMDTMSTVSGDIEYLSVLDFTAVSAQYIRIYATNNGGYVGDPSKSVGELQAYGTEVPVPEPATMLLFGTGLICLISSRRRKERT